jgi:alpha-tubulin suppressor-like RCC1 family protein
MKHFAVAVMLLLTSIACYTQTESGYLLRWGSLASTPVSNNYISISAGDNVTAVVNADGTLSAWGYNRNQQCNLPAGNNYSAVSTAGLGGLALKTDGSLVAWGFSNAVPPGNDFTKICRGYEHCLALKSNGTVLRWIGSSPATTIEGSFTDMSAGSNVSVLLRSDGSLAAFGSNPNGVLNVPAGNDFIAVSGYGYWYIDGYGGSTVTVNYFAALRSNHTIVTWGSSLPAPTGNNYVALDVGMGTLAAIRTDGSIQTWGSWLSPPPAGNDFVAISVGAGHAVALRSDGSMAAWGSNFYGECFMLDNVMAAATGGCEGVALLEDHSLVGFGPYNYGTPMPLTHDFKAIAKSNGAVFGLALDGSLRLWDRFYTYYPSTENNYAKIAAGYDFYLALKTDGTLASWGNNSSGQCNVPNGNHYTSISAGDDFGVAIKTDGSLIAWGSLTAVPTGNDYIEISSGTDYFLALKGNGTITYGGYSNHVTPAIPAGSDFVAVSAGSDHALALRSNGSIVSWGYNLYNVNEPPPRNDYIAIFDGRWSEFSGNFCTATVRNGYVSNDDDNQDHSIGSIVKAYPNPAGRSELINFASLLTSGEHGCLKIYNLKGQQVRSFEINYMIPNVNWNGRDSRGSLCAAGLYLFKLETNFRKETNKMIIVN